MEAGEDMGRVAFQRNKEVDGVNWVWFDSVVGMVRGSISETCKKDAGV